MLASRWMSRWKMQLRSRRRLLRLLLSCAAVGSLLLLVSRQLPERRAVGSPAARLRAAAAAAVGLDQSSCRRVQANRADLQLAQLLPTLNFSASWTSTKTFWNDHMEKRFQNIKRKAPFPLKIMVVPHSHNDPGWGGTIVDYYRQRTRHILNQIVHMMPQLPNMRFMWTEISFLKLWWDDATPSQQQTFIDLVRSGRLEVTTGGWVMTDEAVTRLYPIIDQLTEGHRWLRHHLNVSVRTGWAVDPFGHGSTLPYVLKQAGIHQAVIMRTPYVWKEYLAAHQGGDFIWQQQWDHDGSTSLLTHHHPYFMYTTSAACGPFGESTKMCFNFDFARDWSSPVAWYNQFTHVTDDNIKERAEMLVEAAGRTASLFPHNVALMMLGADFQFKHAFEWREQYSNYSRLIDYIARHPELGAEVQFSTPAEYFAAVRQRSGQKRPLPTLVGDFHVYSDVFQAKPKYWSGFYTTVPHWKRAARQLEAHLRASEILYMWAWNQNVMKQRDVPMASYAFMHTYERLIMCRQDLALFNHHDAITGTSNNMVMSDYISRLSISDLDMTRADIMAMSALMLELGWQKNANDLFDEYKTLSRGLGVLPQLVLFEIEPDSRRRLLLYNPVAQNRTDVVQFLTVNPSVIVTANSGEKLPSQIEPFGKMFRVSALVPSDPLSINVLFVSAKSDGTTPVGKQIADADIDDMFSLRNDRFIVTFNKTALTLSVHDSRDRRTTPFRTWFGRYRTVPRESGLYLFAVADNTPEPLPCAETVWHVRRGPVLSEASMTCVGKAKLTIQLYHTAAPIGQAVHMQTELQLTHHDDESDVFLRVETGVKSCSLHPGCGLYTDSNDYQMVWRPLARNAGVPGNIYPVTTQATLQDSKQRVSVLMDHTHGVGSLAEGEFTIILDRRSMYDDDRGIGQGNQANKPVRSTFSVVFERLPAPPTPGELFANSPLVALLSRQLNRPVHTHMGRHSDAPRVKGPLRLIDRALPCDWEMVTLRQIHSAEKYEMPGQTVQLTLLRRRLDCSLWDPRDGLSCRPGASTSASFSPYLLVNSLVPTALTGGRLLPAPRRLSSLSEITLQPDQLRSFEMHMSNSASDKSTSIRPEEENMVRQMNDA